VADFLAIGRMAGRCRADVEKALIAAFAHEILNRD
jgi:hypothetical protein